MQTIANEPLSAKVCQALKKAIVSGELTPRHKATETGLAKMLGVSRTPVREALRVLNVEGFVTLRENSGISINEFNLENTLALLEIRGRLEGQAAALATWNLTGEQKLRLTSANNLLQELRMVDGRYDSEEFMQADRAFHAALLEIADDEELAREHAGLGDRLFRLRTSTLSVGQDDAVDLARLHHQAIFEAVVNGDAELARELAAEHTHFIGQYLRRLMK